LFPSGEPSHRPGFGAAILRGAECYEIEDTFRAEGWHCANCDILFIGPELTPTSIFCQKMPDAPDLIVAESIH
jgi:hypothetical protein